MKCNKLKLNEEDPFFRFESSRPIHFKVSTTKVSRQASWKTLPWLFSTLILSFCSTVFLSNIEQVISCYLESFYVMLNPVNKRQIWVNFPPRRGSVCGPQITPPTCDNNYFCVLFPSSCKAFYGLN